MVFNLLKILHSFKNGFYYRQPLFLAFVFQRPELLLSLCKMGRKIKQKQGDRVGEIPQGYVDPGPTLPQSPGKVAGFPGGEY